MSNNKTILCFAEIVITSTFPNVLLIRTKIVDSGGQAKFGKKLLAPKSQIWLSDVVLLFVSFTTIAGEQRRVVLVMQVWRLQSPLWAKIQVRPGCCCLV